MNNQTQEALKMAIAEIEGWIDHAYGHTPEECADNKALKACKEALAQPAQEPVAVCKDSIVNWVNGKAIDGWLYTRPAPQPSQEPVLNVVKILNEFPLLDDEGLDEDKHHCEWAIQQDRKRLHAMIKNTHPAPSWQGLSDDEIEAVTGEDIRSMYSGTYNSYRAIEQALKEKNHG